MGVLFDVHSKFIKNPALEDFGSDLLLVHTELSLLELWSLLLMNLPASGLDLINDNLC